jgi:FAD-dependent urate hydroxylase
VTATEVLIIGAGPFGVSISAHLRALGVDHVIVGKPMNSWRTRMPVGMLMKSEPYASEIASPDGRYDVGTYSRKHGLDYVDRVGPLTLEHFLSYADWYTEQLVPDVKDLTAANITAKDGKYEVAFHDGDAITARQVVIATGVLPFANVPAELAGLPADLLTHASDVHLLDGFSGKKVAVIGAGQSALETAALLHENGAQVQIIARIPAINWIEPNPAHISAIGKIRRPVTRLCEGWHCAFWNNPTAFRRLPEDIRIVKARTVLGPNGSWWLKDRVDGVIDTLAGHKVRSAEPAGSGVRLELDGTTKSTEADHVVAGTGYRIDLERLPFLPQELRAGIATVKGYPAVSRVGESSVPGLYFVGAPTAVSVGPSARFVAGTHTMAAHVAKAAARKARGRKGQAAEPEYSLPR